MLCQQSQARWTNGWIHYTIMPYVLTHFCPIHSYAHLVPICICVVYAILGRNVNPRFFLDMSPFRTTKRTCCSGGWVLSLMHTRGKTCYLLHKELWFVKMPFTDGATLSSQPQCVKPKLLWLEKQCFIMCFMLFMPRDILSWEMWQHASNEKRNGGFISKMNICRVREVVFFSSPTWNGSTTGLRA